MRWPQLGNPTRRAEVVTIRRSDHHGVGGPPRCCHIPPVVELLARPPMADAPRRRDDPYAGQRQPLPALGPKTTPRSLSRHGRGSRGICHRRDHQSNGRQLRSWPSGSILPSAASANEVLRLTVSAYSLPAPGLQRVNNLAPRIRDHRWRLDRFGGIGAATDSRQLAETWSREPRAPCCGPVCLLWLRPGTASPASPTAGSCEPPVQPSFAIRGVRGPLPPVRRTHSERSEGAVSMAVEPEQRPPR
jgi:hypothetical protein